DRSIVEAFRRGRDVAWPFNLDWPGLRPHLITKAGVLKEARPARPPRVECDCRRISSSNQTAQQARLSGVVWASENIEARRSGPTNCIRVHSGGRGRV